MIQSTHEDRSALIDLLCDVVRYPGHESLEVLDLNRLTTEQLRAMVNREPVAPAKPSIDPLKPLTLSQAVNLYPDYEYTPRKRIRGPLRPYKAQLRHEGKNVYLGSFYTPVEAYAAVQAAKLRRSMGLPVKL